MARRAAKACSSCHTRKTRCDAHDVGLPCTKCKADGFQCVIEPKKKRRSRIRVRHASGAAAAGAAAGAEAPEPRIAFPEHVLRHQMPHYAFFRNAALIGWPQPSSSSSSSSASALGRKRGLILPIVPRDEAADARNAFAEDMRFLKLKGAFDLPPKPVLDECVAAYFRIFHPFFPVIDRPAFLACYEQSTEETLMQGKGPSLLLLQAIVFIAVAYLHQFDYESDDIVTIQALLLMSHHFPSVAEQKHTWYWAYQAISLVQGAGLHRECGPIPERKLWGRVWWCCLVRDRLISLGTNRPMHINSLDCNVPLPVASDLDEVHDTDDDRTIKAMFVDFVKLCYYIEGVLSLPYVAPDALRHQISVCEATLQSWTASLSPASRRRQPDETIAPSSTSTGLHRVYRALLHLIFNIVRIAILQSSSTMDKDRADGSRPPSADARSVAAESTELLDELLTLDLVQYLPTHGVTAVLSTLIVQILAMRYAADVDSYELEKKRFKICIDVLEQLGQTYWHAQFYHDIFQLAASSTPCGADGQAHSHGHGQRPGSFRPKRPLRAKTTPDADHAETIALTCATGDPRAGVSVDYARPQGQSRVTRTLHASDPEPPTDDNLIEGNEGDPSLLPSSTALDALAFTGQCGDAECQFHLFNGWLDDDTLFQTLFPSV
ncbi:Transcription factor [Niveomyces insectorum RCEF 264]|uniref:Transcription factor n=1 Tax=Niveomyces insectorum RCEF 264 TaxID=1081102 RepID=A0A167YZP5_9HYPO|nr:Transcription factor [Niveomyces insectorum RCEF 264]